MKQTFKAKQLCAACSLEHQGDGCVILSALLTVMPNGLICCAYPSGTKPQSQAACWWLLLNILFTAWSSSRLGNNRWRLLQEADKISSWGNAESWSNTTLSGTFIIGSDNQMFSADKLFLCLGEYGTFNLMEHINIKDFLCTILT